MYEFQTVNAVKKSIAVVLNVDKLMGAYKTKQMVSQRKLAASTSSQVSCICGSVRLHGGMTSYLGRAWWLYWCYVYRHLQVPVIHIVLNRLYHLDGYWPL